MHARVTRHRHPPHPNPSKSGTATEGCPLDRPLSLRARTAPAGPARPPTNSQAPRNQGKSTTHRRTPAKKKHNNEAGQVRQRNITQRTTDANANHRAANTATHLHGHEGKRHFHLSHIRPRGCCTTERGAPRCTLITAWCMPASRGRPVTLRCDRVSLLTDCG